MGLMLEGLDLLGTRPAPQDGEPMRLPVDAIGENPGQPRFEFDEEALHELAQTIRERGVRQPISVRPSPAAEGRWLLNSGARRLRASKLAGRTDIPAFIDVSADSYDQVIENEQREGLKRWSWRCSSSAAWLPVTRRPRSRGASARARPM